MEHALIFCCNTLEEIHIQNCELVDSQLMGIKSGFEDAIRKCEKKFSSVTNDLFLKNLRLIELRNNPDLSDGE